MFKNICKAIKNIFSNGKNTQQIIVDEFKFDEAKESIDIVESASEEDEAVEEIIVDKFRLKLERIIRETKTYRIKKKNIKRLLKFIETESLNMGD
ncbi:hypothetical protein [Fusobacterium varium]